MVSNLINSKTRGLKWKCPEVIEKLRGLVEGNLEKKEAIQILTHAINEDLKTYQPTLPSLPINDLEKTHPDSDEDENDFIVVDSD
jgi:hypothetical protein